MKKILVCLFVISVGILIYFKFTSESSSPNQEMAKSSTSKTEANSAGETTTISRSVNAYTESESAPVEVEEFETVKFSNNPVNSEEGLKSLHSKILSEDEEPEMRAYYIDQYFENNANKQEVFVLTQELLQESLHPKIFERALFVHGAFLNRNEQISLLDSLSKKHSDPKIQKILKYFSKKNGLNKD